MANHKGAGAELIDPTFPGSVFSADLSEISAHPERLYEIESLVEGKGSWKTI
jgi:hypothetical protein